MSLTYWILVGHTPIETDMHEWARFIESGQHQLFLARATTPEGHDVIVSTIFLGIDHSSSMRALANHPDHVPDLFETMLFPKASEGSDASQYEGVVLRTRSWEEARDTHESVLHDIKAGESP